MHGGVIPTMPYIATTNLSTVQYIYTYIHTVMCQWPRKPCGAQACYLHEPLTRRFQLVVSL